VYIYLYHSNHRNHTEDIVLETHEEIFEEGSNHRIEIMMENPTDITRPIPRIKRIRVDMRMEPDDWLQKTREEYWAGQTVPSQMKQKPKHHK
jgi:hypothetical protein